MNRIDNLIGACYLLSDIQKGNTTHTPTAPTGLLNVADTQAPPVIVNLFNQCRKDKALLKDSNALVTLHAVGLGNTKPVRSYWKHAETFGETLDRLESALTPLPSTPTAVKAILDELTEILTLSETCSQGITESLKEMKAEIDVKVAQSQGAGTLALA